MDSILCIGIGLRIHFGTEGQVVINHCDQEGRTIDFLPAIELKAGSEMIPALIEATRRKLLKDAASIKGEN